MADLEHRRTMLTGAITGPNASYDSAIDSLPDESYCELVSSPSVSFHRSPSLSVYHHNHHHHRLHQHSSLSSPPAAAAAVSSSSPSASLSLNGPILSSNNLSKSFNSNHPSAQSPLYRLLADYHRLYNGHTARQSSSPSDSLHLSVTTKCIGRPATATDSQMLTTNLAVLSGHSGSCLRSNYQTTTGALTATSIGSSKRSTRLSDSCLNTRCAGTSAILAPAAHSSRRVTTGPISSSGCNNNNNNNNSSSRITGTEQQQKKTIKEKQQQPPPGASASAANDTEDYVLHVHLQLACECSRRTDRQQVCSVHSPTADTTTTTATTSKSNSTAATLFASSLLRSSRSFTTSYRQRPNVTLIRRKSASERLAESRSKYIRSDLVDGERTLEDSAERSANSADCCHLCAQWATEDKVATTDDGTAYSNGSTTGKGSCTMKLLRTTPTSTKSSHTSSSRLSPISDHVYGQGQTQAGNLVDRINDQLNKSKQYNVSSCQKKRVSPRNSEGSAALPNGMSQLELKLRELITIDSSSELLAPQSTAADQQSRTLIHPSAPFPEAASAGYDSRRQLQQEREAENLYRATLKFIGSSNSSLSSMYSEPNHESLSPIDSSQFNHLLLSGCGPVAPSAGEDAKQSAQNLVIRSKSDVSPEKQQQMTERYRNCRTEKLFSSIDSNLYQSTHEQDLSGENLMLRGNHKSSGGSPNLQIGHSLGSPSQESLCKREKDSVDMNIVQRLVPSKPKMTRLVSTAKSCSINELSSLESSQLSVSEHLFKSALNHSKSTSKLTFENLMMHQQNLASSRSCHNLVASLQSGPSVVERNAKIIKWLFNCRQAQTQLHAAHTADVVFQ